MKIGIDIVEVDRIEKLYERINEKIDNIFTNKEIEYAFRHKNMFQILAGRFAAKEAYKKAVTTDINFKSIEILNDENGKPYYNINGEILKNIDLSISHEKNYAVAVAIKF